VKVNESVWGVQRSTPLCSFVVGAEHGALLFSMLTDLDEDLDAAAEKMGMVMGSLAKLLKTKGASVLFT
jgi:hypothetical protein